MRGLGWLESYFEDDNNFIPVGLDAVTIFLEASITSRNVFMRDKARRAATALARRLEQHYVSEAGSLEKADLIDIIDFLAEAKYLGIEPTRLLAIADRMFSESKNDEDIYVFRSMGFNSATDAMVRSGTRFLLQAQNEDGSWGRWWEEEDPYDAVHYTWCAMAGLRDRTFLQDTRYSKRIRRILEQVH